MSGLVHNALMLTLLLLSLTVLSRMQEPVVARSSVKSLQCEAAVELIQDAVLPNDRKIEARDIVFRQDIRVASGTQGGTLTDRFKDNPPSPPSSLLLRLEAQGDVDAVERCPEVRVLLHYKGVRFDQRSVERASRLKRNLASRAIIYGASLPVLSDDGRQALFMQNMSCGGRCGSGELIHAERSATGKWVVVSRYLLWVR